MTTAVFFERLLRESAPNCTLGADLEHFFAQVPAFFATVFAIMMLWRDQYGTVGRYSGRFDGALGVGRGVGNGNNGAGGPPVAATNIAFIWTTLGLVTNDRRLGNFLRDIGFAVEGF